jgi:aryl-alcohol dehydrogenase-like predicted oxidoreductase
MQRRELGTTGEQVSQLALGCMGLGTLADDRASFDLLDRYAADGGTFLDTADCYSWFHRPGTPGGQSEEVIGRWLARTGRRDQTFLSTKGSAMVSDLRAVWRPDGEQQPWETVRSQFVGAGAVALRRSLEGSLRRLGVDHVDLYFVHVDDRATPLTETLSTLADFVQEGKVRHLGWSNVRSWRLERIRSLCAAGQWPQPVALQQEHSYLPRRAGLVHDSIVDDEQLDYLRHRPDLSLIAYSPVLKGLYDTPAAERGDHPALGPYAGDETDRRLRAVDAVAAETGATPGQVVLAWLTAQTSPRRFALIGTTRTARYRQAAQALDLTLTAEQMARLNTPELPDRTAPR